MTDDGFEAQLDARARERWNAQTQAVIDDEPEGDPAEDDALLERVLEQIGERTVVVPMRPRWQWIAATAAVLAAVLVATVLVWPRASALPEYDERTFEGGVAEVRADGPRAPVFLPSTRIRWSFAPREEVSEPIALRIRAEGPTRRCIAVEHGQRVAATGAVEIEGPLGEVLDLEPGEWTLTALIGARSSIEDAADPCDANARGVVEVATRSITVREQ